MSNAPRVDIDPAAFCDDPYPALAALRRDHPIACQRARQRQAQHRWRAERTARRHCRHRVFDEYARWMSPIGMTPRRVARRCTVDGVTLQPEDRVFFMSGSASRDDACFGRWAFRGPLALPACRD